ncbi:histidine kinase [Conexibacter sp. JD483]|uniref:sensor histidine kinase n=1 Tax=unclassified Conexibacter TaxID=2627773 RepID=UPI0027221867|nr:MULTISPECIES: ATP-binding protein [unclassified Conexibacter]MDO8185692.1 histidine kinase [Conexibacter sp. CPCC 205706]MDO8199069.1 histidine kinase [Conexibacter sp. CPCC 205762]MDR9370512.1 histidine kinase [Conexibacter sp. JD483]
MILHQGGEFAWLTAWFPALGLVYVTTGLLAWVRRPSSRLGLLLVVAGGFALLAEVVAVDAPVPVAVGMIVGTVILAVIVQLLLSFPTGRLHTRTERLVVLAGYLVCLPLQAPLYLYAAGNPLSLADRPDLADAGLQVQRIAGALVVIATAALLIERMRQARPEQRRVLVPLSVYGIFALLVVPVSSALEQSVFDGDPVPRTILQLVSLGFVPIVFVVAASRGGFDRTSDLAELGVWLGSDESGRPELRAALATTLGDPSVQVLFRVQGEEALVDDRGIPVLVAAGANGRGTVDVELGGRVVGAIAYDAMLFDRPEEIREAGRIVAIALDRQRLTVELRASRARIAATADGERRRIARDLHDGLQARLVLLAVQAAGDNDRETLRAGIRSAIVELRELVDGVMPAQLTERGLAAAIEDLRDRLPLPIVLHVAGLDQRLRLDVESAAYFVVSEAISNALKHAGPAALTVSLARTGGLLALEVADDGAGGARARSGGGIRGMADRVEALGGELHVDSVPGRGTRVRAVIPSAA